MPGTLGIGPLDHVDDQGRDQQHWAKLPTWNQGTNGHNQMQDIADRAHRVERLEFLQRRLIKAGIIRRGGKIMSHLLAPSRVNTLRSAFSSMPLVPARRSSSATTSAGVRP